MDPITLDQLRVFISVVEEGSFSAAGRRLNRAQSAISYAIGNLERQLELQLFDRSTRTPTLTEVGEALLRDARSVAVEFDRLRLHASEMAGGMEPRVCLAVDVFFPTACLIELLRAFREEHPQVAVMLHTEALGAVEQLVASDVCHIGVCGPRFLDSVNLARRELMQIELVSVASPSHPLGQADGDLDLAAVQEHTQLVLTDRSPVTEGRDFGVLSPSTWRLADLSTKHAMLRAGFGWGNMPLHMVEADLASGALKRLPMQPEPGRFPLYTVRKLNRALGPAAQWLLDQLEQTTPPRLR